MLSHYEELLGALLVSTSGGVALDDILLEFRRTTFEELPFLQSQYSSLEEFLLKHYSSVCFIDDADEKRVVKPKPLKEVAHLIKLVYGQSTPKTKTPPSPVTHKPVNDTLEPVANTKSYVCDGDTLTQKLNALCVERGLPVPTYEVIEMTPTSTKVKHFYCVINIGNKKVTSYPSLCPSESCAKAESIQKALGLLFGPITDRYRATTVPSVIAGKPQEVDLPTDISALPSTTVEDASCNSTLPFSLTPSEDSSPLKEPPAVRLPTSKTLTFFPPPSRLVTSPIQKTFRPMHPPSPIPEKTLPTKSNLLESNVVDGDLNVKLIQGYLCAVKEDGTVVVQVEGSQLEQWERLEYKYDPSSPAQEYFPGKWVCVVTEFEGAKYVDRAICDSSKVEADGTVRVNIVDNGLIRNVNPQQVFHITNYDQVDQIPPQGHIVHLLGVTGQEYTMGELALLEGICSPVDHAAILSLEVDCEHQSKTSNSFNMNCDKIPHVIIFKKQNMVPVATYLALRTINTYDTD